MRGRKQFSSRKRIVSNQIVIFNLQVHCLETLIWFSHILPGSKSRGTQVLLFVHPINEPLSGYSDSSSEAKRLSISKRLGV
jgi:alpha-D-ribose 1-methylphosphonate 5-phosphate C-P lyase